MNTSLPNTPPRFHEARSLGWFALVVLTAFLGCGGGNPPKCTGTSCVCPAGGACDVTTANCGGSCSLQCSEKAMCSGACGDSCSVDCGAMASCDLTLGKSGSATCAPDSTCHVTCAASCSVSCGTGARCLLKCATESTFKELTGGGSCP
jgi:hypothetical protein